MFKEIIESLRRNKRLSKLTGPIRRIFKENTETKIPKRNKQNNKDGLLKMGLMTYKTARDIPGGPVVRTPHSQCRDTGSIPGQGTKILHATW